ncbi:MAG: acetyl-CoA carboxylase biotin carboxyl carrier protein [Clostridia bacterium]|nr:acetyl-CoA carboxylase biotin carboxyl carrier protein [Clostridia bacterium]
MDIKKIRELVKMMEGSSLTELTLKDSEMEICLSKAAPAPAAAVPAAAAPAPSAPAEPASPAEEEDDTLLITAPIVGTFYSSPAPDARAYVYVGDHVKKGQTVCIIEAMKLMNEIDVDYDCEIDSILVSNEQKVEYGQPLFRVRKV